VLYRLGQLCVRHRYVVAGAWVVFAVAVAIVAKSVGEQTSNNLTLPGTESTETTDLLDQYLRQRHAATRRAAGLDGLRPE